MTINSASSGSINFPEQGPHIGKGTSPTAPMQLPKVGEGSISGAATSSPETKQAMLSTLFKSDKTLTDTMGPASLAPMVQAMQQGLHHLAHKR